MNTDEIAWSQAVDAEIRARCPKDFLLFARSLMIPSANGKLLFDDCMAPFQRECFAELAPNLESIRDGRKPALRRWWIERTKGASKDSDLAVCMLWLLAFPTRPIYLQVGAADKDQAAIIRRRMEDILHYNPWLGEHVEVQKYSAINLPGQYAVLDIVAADIAGSHGETPDVLICNELSHVTKWEFIENLLDNADKVSRGLVLIATNAGIKGSKADKLRKNAINNPRKWTVRVWNKPAPWIDREDVKDARRRTTAGRYNRLWWGRWASGKGDALDEEDIDRCLAFHKGPQPKPRSNCKYVGGLDLGVSHDHAALAVLEIDRTKQKIRLVHMRGFAPNSKTREVDLIEVENACLAVFQTYNVQWFGYDPFEARLMAQRLRRVGVPMREFTFASNKNLTQMASTLLQVLNSGTLEAYDDMEGRLRRDFGKFNIVEKPYGYKLEAVSDEFGHADVGTALAIALPQAVSILSGRGGLEESEDLIGGEEDVELTEKEVENLPDELRDIYGAYDGIENEKGV